MSRTTRIVFPILLGLTLLLAACQPEVIEREVVVTKEVVVTQEVEVEVEREVTVTEVVEIEREPFPEGTELHIVQWSHFVPQYDVWFDPFAEAWGEANQVDVTVDHVGIPDLGPTLSSAIDAGDGPTMVEFLFAPSAFVDGLQDLSDVNLEAQERFGEQVENCANSSYLPAIDKCTASAMAGYLTPLIMLPACGTKQATQTDLQLGRSSLTVALKSLKNRVFPWGWECLLNWTLAWRVVLLSGLTVAQSKMRMKMS